VLRVISIVILSGLPLLLDADSHVRCVRLLVFAVNCVSNPNSRFNRIWILSTARMSSALASSNESTHSMQFLICRSLISALALCLKRRNIVFKVPPQRWG
jgi:hypothetical protein